MNDNTLMKIVTMFFTIALVSFFLTGLSGAATIASLTFGFVNTANVFVIVTKFFAVVTGVSFMLGCIMIIVCVVVTIYRTDRKNHG